MKKTLGLDLGSNSLGWAVLDDITGDILNKGVVVFPEGIDAANDTLETPAAIRRAARMGRRMKFRRKTRKWALLKVLIENKMCPMTMVELAHWKNGGKYPTDNKAFIEWLKSTDVQNPYADRAAAASGKVGELVLGRALYHICQRRGFKSSRKEKIDTGDEKADQKENIKRLGKVAGDIQALNDEISATGCKTLGQYFAKVIDQQKHSIEKKRIRCRYTGRDEHYEVEFSEIMKAQGITPSDKLFRELHKAIFLQRPLRSQKHLAGQCPLEPKSPRCRISHPAYEEFRMLSFVNNLSFENSAGERVVLMAEDRALVCRAFQKASPTMKFGDISKLFKKRLKDEGLKFHYYRDDETISTCPMRHRIAKAFGTVPYDEQEVFDALCFFNDDDKLAGWFSRHYPALDADQVKALVRITPKEGNAKYSLKAINKILPFLRKGFPLFDARFMARLPDLIPDFAVHADEIVLHLREMQMKYRENRESLKDEKFRREQPVLRLMDMYQGYFRDNFGFDEKTWQKLYLHGDSVYAVNPKMPERLPKVELGMIRNPLVQRSMTTLRRLVNYLRDHGTIDGDTTVRIELARGVNDFATRHAIQNWQKKRTAERDAARAELGDMVTEDAVDRFILWQEQGHKCLYTGKSISQKDILSGTGFDIEHTIPRSRSGDDSLANKTLCDSVYNRQVKKGMIPTECGNWSEIEVRLRPWFEKVDELQKVLNQRKRAAKAVSDPSAWSQARIKVVETSLELKYWRDKLHRFTITADKLADSAEGLGGFKKRQLVDTGIMCSHAVDFLRSVYPRTYAVNGTATAFARKAWGIQTDETKDRTSHTHHAKDAMVIAALTPGRFSAICAALKDDGTAVRGRECDICPKPYENFAEKVRKACDEILVKHVLRQTTLKQSSKRNCLAKAHPRGGVEGAPIVSAVLSRGDTVRGALHEDSYYGKIKKTTDGQFVTVIRKKLLGEQITALLAKVNDIVDPAIREIVRSRLSVLKDEKKVVEPGDIVMPSGVPINRVRMFANHAKGASSIRQHVFASRFEYKRNMLAKAADNFRMGLFVREHKITFEIESSLTWAKSHKSPEYVPLERREGFVGCLRPGMAVLVYKDSPEELFQMAACGLRKRLYNIVKFASNGTTFKFHAEARASTVLSADLVAANKHKAGESVIDYTEPHELLLMSASKYVPHMLFEGIHFRMMLDGSIRFL